MYLRIKPPNGAAMSYYNSDIWPTSSNLSARMAASIGASSPWRFTSTWAERYMSRSGQFEHQTSKGLNPNLDDSQPGVS